MTEGYRASDEDWEELRRDAADRFLGGPHRCVLELADRLAALEAAPDRVLVRNQTGEYLRAGTPVYAEQQAANTPSDEELWKIRLQSLERTAPGGLWAQWVPHESVSHLGLAMISSNRALFDAGVAHATASAEQQASAQAASPAPAGGLVEGIMEAACLTKREAKWVLDTVAAWLDRRGQHACSLLLRLEADR